MNVRQLVFRFAVESALLMVVFAAGLAFAHSPPPLEFRDAVLDQVVLPGEPVPPASTQTVMTTVLMALASLLLVLVKIGLASVILHLNERRRGNTLVTSLALAAELVRTYVAKAEVELRPAFAKAENGQLSPQEGAALKAKVMEMLQRDLPASLMSYLSATLGASLENWLSGKIEQAVAEPPPKA